MTKTKQKQKQKRNSRPVVKIALPIHKKKTIRQVPRGPLGSMTSISNCTSDYARALVNPFSGPLACVPNYPALLTLKQRSYVKGTFATGTTGNGWIVADPSYSAVNDQTSAFSTLSTFGGTTVNLVGGGGVQQTESNSQYALGTIGPGLSLVRNVAFGIRIRYIGTELDRGGQIVALCDPNHNSLQGRAFTDFDAEEVSRRFPVDRQWVTVLYSPYFVTDTDFFSNFPVYTPAATDPSFFMGIMVQAASAGVSLSYEYEVYGLYEFQGRNIRGMTPSHVDNVGFGAVNAAGAFGAVSKPHQGPSQPVEMNMLKNVHKNLSQTSSTSTSLNSSSNNNNNDPYNQNSLSQKAANLFNPSGSGVFQDFANANRHWDNSPWGQSINNAFSLAEDAFL